MTENITYPRVVMKEIGPRRGRVPGNPPRPPLQFRLFSFGGAAIFSPRRENIVELFIVKTKNASGHKI